MSRLRLESDRPLHVLVPSRAIGAAIEALSPRVRAHRVQPEKGAPTGAAAQAQVWVPRSDDAVPAEFLAGLPELQLVQLLSAGAERYAGRLPEGVLLCNARGAHTPATAEWVLAATLAMQRGLPSFVREQEAHRWSFGTQRSLHGDRVVVVGAGDIGRTVAAMMAPFGVELTFVARTARDGVRSTDDLPQLLPTADVVVVLVPLTAQTRRMVDADFLAAMADGALLVNAARGEIVDTAALLAQLQAGRLRAALDVTDPEPLPPEHPLWSAPGLLLTPHVGGEVPGTGARGTAAVVEQIRRVLAGEPLANVIDEY